MAEQSLQIKRNKEIFTTKEDAINHLNSLVDKLQYGEIVLWRYFNGETIQTLVGFETKYEITNSNSQQKEVVSAIAYIDSLKKMGKGFYYDTNDVLQLNLGSGLTVDQNNAIQLVLGKGLKIDNDSKVDVKINSNVTNFLQVDDDGLKVGNMGANVTITTEPILVMGGPLATDKVQAVLPKTDDEAQIPYIAANTNLQELLIRLFCNEMYPSISSANVQQGNVTARIHPPLLQLSQTATTLEVGTYISATTISFNDNSIAISNPSMISGLTYGYSFENNNQKESTDTFILREPTTGFVTTATTQMVCALTGFTGTKFNPITGNTVLSANTAPLIS